MNALKHLKEIAAIFAPSERANLLDNSWTMRSCIATARILSDKEVISESGIESCFYLAAELTHSCISIITQPFTADIAGMFRYTPDAIVMTQSGPYVVECKPSRENFDPEFCAKVRAIRAEFKHHDLSFVVIDEHDVCG